MTKKRFLLLGLDGFEITLAERLMAEGRMPYLAGLRDRSRRYQLDHGAAKYTGLAWEHVSTAKTPEALNRHSAVAFDPLTYSVSQEPTATKPVFADFKSRCLLIDVPYCDLDLAPEAQGIARWGAHDPGAPRSCRPESLYREMRWRFGNYPAEEHIYAMVWPSVVETEKAGRALVRAVRRRARVSEWLMSKRCSDWELAVVTVSEPHSAIEPLWHGVDQMHPLHAHASAPAAGHWLEKVYEETDALIGRLKAAAPDAYIGIFAMHGMGSNGADVPAMVLLPELLHRKTFGKAYMKDIPWADTLPDGTPSLADGETWHDAMRARIPDADLADVERALSKHKVTVADNLVPQDIDWQPAARYRPYWPAMEAFAMPSFYDGRIRLNLAGREAGGVVSPNRYQHLIDELKALLRECRCPVTGDAVVEGFSQPETSPMDVGPTESDLYIYWKGLPRGLVHPELGTIGPIPFRRAGGHSGDHGFLYLSGKDLRAGDFGEVSSFDVMPTVMDILGEDIAGTSGQSLLVKAQT